MFGFPSICGALPLGFAPHFEGRQLAATQNSTQRLVLHASRGGPRVAGIHLEDKHRLKKQYSCMPSQPGKGDFSGHSSHRRKHFFLFVFFADFSKFPILPSIGPKDMIHCLLKMSIGAESVRQAVLALYRGNLAQQADANTWLTDFQKSTEAWQTAHELLQQTEPQEIQFFAASLLIRKVRSEWARTDPALQQQLQTAFTTTFQDVLTWNNASPLVLRQLCLLQAAVLASPAPGHPTAVDLVVKAIALLHIQPDIALELLTAIAEEVDDLQPRRRAVLATSLLSNAPEVYGALGALLTQALQQAQHVAAAQALRTTLAWVQLSPHPSGGAADGQLGPAEFSSHHPQLFQAVLTAVAGPSSSGDVAAGAAAVLLAVLASSTFGPEEDHDAIALSAIIDALLSVRPRLPVVDEQTALAVAQVGAAVAERWPEGACEPLNSSIPLAELMVECFDRTEPLVGEAAIDYFYMINTVPLAHRPPSLGPPLFQAMVARLQRHVAYPEGFPPGGWAEDGSDIDPEVFSRMREAVVPEALQEAYGLLRSRYLSWAWETLQTAPTWQVAEAALYSVGAVALAVRSRALAGPEMLKNPAVAEDAGETRALLSALFERVCGGGNVAASPLLSAHSALACTACWVLEQYAVWFGKAEGAPVQEALQALLGVLTTSPQAANAAAKAFNAMCMRCACRIKDPLVVGALLEPVHAALAGGLAQDEETLLVEGMAQVVAGLPNEQAEAAAAQLTRPFVDALRAAVAAAGGREPSPASRQAATRALLLVAAALKSFLSAALTSGASANSGGPAVGVLMSVEGALGAVARCPHWQRDPEVMSALVEVYKRAVCSARRRSLELLPAVMPAVGAVFAATALPSCLDVLAESVEIHFQDQTIVDQLLLGMGSACEDAFPVLQSEGIRERGPLAAALLGLADSFAVYAPASLWPSPLLAPLLGLAIVCVGEAREVEPVTRALSMLGHVLSTQERALGDPGPGVGQGQIDAVHAALMAQGQSMVEALLRALCDTCPRQLMRNAGDRLRSLLTHPVLGQNAAGWVQGTVMSGQLPGIAEGILTQEVCVKFCTLALGGSLRIARLTALLVDFGLVARREETADVLLAYEL